MLMQCFDNQVVCLLQTSQHELLTYDGMPIPVRPAMTVLVVPDLNFDARYSKGKESNSEDV
jgi:hypothetical protein